MKKKVFFIGFWKGYDNSEYYRLFNNFILTDNIDDCDILVICSFLNENEYDIIIKKKCIKILYITEPIEYMYKIQYKLYNENNYDLVYGCINNDITKNFYKNPIYIKYYDYKDSCNIFNNINNYVKTCNIDDKKFATMICTHDNGSTRTKIYNELKTINHIDCPSKLFNNNSNIELNSIGNIEYIKKFKYNICPENYNTINIKGYITEKLLNCCLAGSIPIYYGNGYDEIDEKIFNKNRILFYDPFDNDSILKIKNTIIFYENNPTEFDKFYRQDIFYNDAYKIINDLHDNLINKINELNEINKFNTKDTI
jgi:hypothetical protein